MTRSASRARAAVILCAAVLGCDGGGGGDGGTDFLQQVQGAWLACEADPLGDLQLVNTIADRTSRRSLLAWTSTGGSCTGQVTAYEGSSATFTVGGEVAATHEGRSVTARAVDAMSSGQPYYTIAWVDTAATPDVLYEGDDSADPARDGATAERRPVVLESRGLAAGARPPVLDFLEPLQGTWISCSNDGGGALDDRERLTFEGLVVTSRGFDHPSTDATCTGAETASFELAGFATLGPQVTATLGGVAVAGARAMDVSFTGRAPFYSIVWIDTAANPDVLYTGDESADPARDATTPDRRPTVLQDWRPRVKAP